VTVHVEVDVETMGEKLRIGEVAAKAGVTTRTIRYYESLGLMGPSERPGAFRAYEEAAVLRLRKIDSLKQLGLSLEEIGTVLDLYFEDPTGIRGKKKVLAIMREHLRETEEKIDGLERFRADLEEKIASVERFIEEASRTHRVAKASRS
jgi:DNA-binding transcriptional MerR regulator